TSGCRFGPQSLNVAIKQMTCVSGFRALPPTARPTSRRPIPERYARNAASYLERVRMQWAKLLIRVAGDARVRRCGVADNKSRFLSTRTSCVPLAQWRLAPVAKFDLH